MRAPLVTPRQAPNPVKPNAPIKKPNEVQNQLGRFAHLQIKEGKQQVRRKLDYQDVKN